MTDTRARTADGALISTGAVANHQALVGDRTDLGLPSDCLALNCARFVSQVERGLTQSAHVEAYRQHGTARPPMAGMRAPLLNIDSRFPNVSAAVAGVNFADSQTGVVMCKVADRNFKRCFLAHFQVARGT